jgi:2'-5' RNA ligase
VGGGAGERSVGAPATQSGPASLGDKYAHKFTAHVTVARLRHPEPAKVIEWLTHHALYTSPEFQVGAFQLYSSRLTSDGSVYAVEQDYPLEVSHDQAAD